VVKVLAAITLAILAMFATAPTGRATSTPTPTPTTMATSAPLPTPGTTGGTPCDIPGLNGVCSTVGGLIQALPNPVGAAAGALVGAAENSFSHWLADGAASILSNILQAATTGLQPDLRPRSFFAGRLQTVVGLAGGVALLFLLFAVGQSLLRGDPALIVSALCIRLPIAFVVTAALLFLTSTALAVVDQATAYVIGGSLQQAATQFMINLTTAFSSADFGGVGLALVALCALGTILVGILLYAELAIRGAVIYLALLFMPLGLAASVWGSAGRIARRLADVLITAILAKFVILVALWFAAGLLAQATSGGEGSGFGTFVIGLVVLFVAAMSPLVLLGLVAHAEHAVASIGDTRRAAYAPPQRAASAGHRAGRAALMAASGGASTVAIVDGGAAAAGGSHRGGGGGPGSTTVVAATATPPREASAATSSPPGRSAAPAPRTAPQGKSPADEATVR
jgi:hypothetical protein